MPTGPDRRDREASTLCPDARPRRGTCPDGSQIGDVTVGAGAGRNPFFITDGRAYLTGPYKGAPFGLSIVVPAVAGPFDLGNVVVRSAIFVDQHDRARCRVVSDPLPTILQGIPLDVRDVRVTSISRGFIVNPTSCAEKTVSAHARVDAGAMRAASRPLPGRRLRAASRFKPRDDADRRRPRPHRAAGARRR